MVDTQIEKGQENTNNELNQFKEEMIARIVQEMQKKDPTINFVGKKSISKYLLDDKKNSFRNFFTGIGINIFSASSEKLKELREKIKKINTKEELGNLEKSIIDNINEYQNNQKTSGSTSSTSVQTATSNSTTENKTSHESSTETIESVDSAKVGELANVPKSKEARLKRLFPSGTPKSKEEMEKYLTKIEIPVRTQDGKEDKLKLNIHVKLANEIKAIFKEMYDKNIPVNTKKTGSFCWRKIRRGNSMSQHSYGSAIDVNYDVNGGVYGKTDKSSPYFNGSETVNIFKKHGFFRGGDWSAKSNDPMHFGFYNG